MTQAICYIILSPSEEYTFYQMQKVIASWQEYYEFLYAEEEKNGGLVQAFISGGNSVEIEPFSYKPKGFRITFDKNWLNSKIENLGIAVAGYELVREFVDEYSLLPAVHLIADSKRCFLEHSFKNSRILQMFIDLGIEQLHLDLMNDKKEEMIDVLGEIKENDSLEQITGLQLHFYTK